MGIYSSTVPNTQQRSSVEQLTDDREVKIRHEPLYVSKFSWLVLKLVPWTLVSVFIIDVYHITWNSISVFMICFPCILLRFIFPARNTAQKSAHREEVNPIS